MYYGCSVMVESDKHDIYFVNKIHQAQFLASFFNSDKIMISSEMSVICYNCNLISSIAAFTTTVKPRLNESYYFQIINNISNGKIINFDKNGNILKS